MTTCMGNCLWWCLFVLSFFPRGVLDEILNLIEFLRVFLPTLYYNSSQNTTIKSCVTSVFYYLKWIRSACEIKIEALINWNRIWIKIVNSWEKMYKMIKTLNQVFTTKLFQQGYRCLKLRQAFSNFYRRHYELNWCLSLFRLFFGNLEVNWLLFLLPKYFIDVVWRIRDLQILLYVVSVKYHL